VTVPAGPYIYRATLTRLIDGDTVVADVDLGWHVWRRDEHLRLAHINAPEMSVPAGEAALEYLTSIVAGDGKFRPVTLRTLKDRDDNYGRLLAELYLDDGTYVNDEMLSSGYAVPWPKKAA
jgi:micrococcal nuclease